MIILEVRWQWTATSLRLSLFCGCGEDGHLQGCWQSSHKMVDGNASYVETLTFEYPHNALFGSSLAISDDVLAVGSYQNSTIQTAFTPVILFRLREPLQIIGKQPGPLDYISEKPCAI